MKVNSINSYQSFGAKIKINKSMLNNIKKDASDARDFFVDSTFSYSTNSIGHSSRGWLANPIPDENGLFEPTQEIIDDMGQMVKNISKRNIMPSVIVKSKGNSTTNSKIPS